MATLNKEEMLALANNPAAGQTFDGSPAKVEDLGVIGGAPGQQRGEVNLGKIGTAPLDKRSMLERVQNRFESLPPGPDMRAPYAQAREAAEMGPPGPRPAAADTGSPDVAAPGVPNDAALQMQNAASGTEQIGMDKDAAEGAVNQFGQVASTAIASAEDKQNQADQAGMAAIDAQKKLDSAKMHAEAKVHGEITVAAKNYEAKMAQIAQQAEAQTKQALADIQTASQAAQQFQFKDFWASRNGMGQAMGIFAAMMGGLANGAAGNPGAATPLDRVIAQDLEMQKLQYSKLRDNVADKRSYFQDLVQQTGSLQAAEQAHYQAVTAKFTAMLQSAADSTIDQQVKVNAMNAIANLKQKSADKYNDHAKMLMSAAQAQMSEQVRIDLAQQQIHLAGMKLFGTMNQNPFAAVGVAKGNFTKSEQVAVQNQLRAGQTADQLFDRLINHPDLFQDETARKQLKEAIAAVEGPGGRLSKMVIDAFDVGGGKGMLGQVMNRVDIGGIQRKKLEEARALMVTALRNSFKNHGAVITPAANNTIRGLYQPDDQAAYDQWGAQYGEQPAGQPAQGAAPSKKAIPGIPGSGR